uniref:Uncharacterized protein n=1 Tax=Ciona savignyi TaxID=51511 RepID=H2ZPJ1_CIOSA
MTRVHTNDLISNWVGVNIPLVNEISMMLLYHAIRQRKLTVHHEIADCSIKWRNSTRIKITKCEADISRRSATLELSQKLSIAVYTTCCCASPNVPLDTEHVPLANCSRICFVWEFSDLNIIVSCPGDHKRSIRHKADEFVKSPIVVPENTVAHPISVHFVFLEKALAAMMAKVG